MYREVEEGDIGGLSGTFLAAVIAAYRSKANSKAIADVHGTINGRLDALVAAASYSRRLEDGRSMLNTGWLSFVGVAMLAPG
jgi:hypothetical protein